MVKKKKLQKKSLGGILGSAASGAGVGATIGNIPGAIIGGIIGLGGGIMGHINEKKAQKEQQLAASAGGPSSWQLLAQQQQQGNMQQNMYDASSWSSQSTNPFTPTFPFGGSLGNPQAEIEGGEVVRFPNGTLDRPTGPSHAGGGIDITAKEATQIFTDRSKIGKNDFEYDPKITYAAQADMIKKEIDKYKKMLA